jgi:LacI family transcriptional regulator
VAAVNTAVEQLGYRRNRVAQALRARSTGLVGIVAPQVSNPFFAALIEALDRELRDEDLELILADSRASVEEEARRIQILVDHNVDALFLIPTDHHLSAPALRFAQRSGPVVQIDQQVDGVESDYVGVDNTLGMRAILSHVVEVGARRVIFVSGSTGSRRREAFETEVRKVKGLVASPTLIGTFSVDFGQEAVAQLLRRRRLPDAIICGADIIALGVLRGLSDRHIDVPSQVKVTGFDGILFAEFCEPPITTASQPVEAIAGEAVDLLRARLSGDVSPPHRHEIAPVLKVRRSSRAIEAA